MDNERTFFFGCIICKKIRYNIIRFVFVDNQKNLFSTEYVIIEIIYVLNYEIYVIYC